MTEEDEVVLRLQKSAAGVESGNLGQRALLLGASGKEAELDEEGCDTVMKFAGAYSATMNVPSLLATHETSSRAVLGGLVVAPLTSLQRCGERSMHRLVWQQSRASQYRLKEFLAR